MGLNVSVAVSFSVSVSVSLFLSLNVPAAFRMRCVECDVTVCYRQGKCTPVMCCCGVEVTTTSQSSLHVSVAKIVKYRK